MIKLNEQQLESLKLHLAVNVMGWTKNPYESEFYGIKIKGSVALELGIAIDDWNPLENIEQAMMCLNTFEQWGISRNLVDDDYFVSIVKWVGNKDDDKDWEAEHESLPMAISLASAKTTRWKK